MATFEVKVVEVEGIEPIEGADRIELAVIGGYRSVVKKDEFKTGDLAVYIPEQALLPQHLLEQLGLVNDRGEGKLAGRDGNRVKAVKLRGTLSQGITAPVDLVSRDVQKGDDVKEELGITKWEPDIPAQMAGEVANLTGHTVKYDIENLKKFSTTYKSGEVFELDVLVDENGDPILPDGVELIEVVD